MPSRDFPNELDPIIERVFGAPVSRPSSSLSSHPRYRTVTKGLSPEDYNSVVRKAEARAREEYQSHVLDEVMPLQENHEILSEALQIAEDAHGGLWRQDPTNLQDRELSEAVETLRLKLKVVRQENVCLEWKVHRMKP
jgi:hypothetical protein